MKLTEAFKKWLVEHCGVKADASDDEFRKAAGEALASGSLSAQKFTELQSDPVVDQANDFAKKLDLMSSGLEKMVAAMEKMGAPAPDPAPAPAPTPDPAPTPAAPEWHKSMKTLMSLEVPLDSDGNIRVKGAWEAYDGTKTALVYPNEAKNGKAHPLAGKTVRDMDHDLHVPSDLDKAVVGAYAKLMCASAQRGGSKTFGFQALPQHDKELLCYAMEKMPWGGSSNGGNEADIVNRPLTPSEAKALIDDATSGGLEAAPIVFDDMVIEAPLLYGELFPLVNVVPLDRGRRIEGVAVGRVTGGWGGVDDTVISLFNTASYVSAFDTTIYRWEGAIRIGLDFLSDTPVDFGAAVSRQYGERLLEVLDDVVAIGNGTTQPEGVMNKSGTTSVAFGGTSTISTIESLRYGVAKAEHRATVANSAVFCGTETTYQRWRALPVGASDARRLFGMDHIAPNGGGYMIAGTRFAVNESMANTQAFYAILARYRMYRRRGLTMRTSTEGDTLIRNNEMLMALTARYGGQLERGATAAVSTTLAS